MSALPSGDDLEYAVKRLRLAAVDAFMCGPGGDNSRGGGFDRRGGGGHGGGYYGRGAESPDFVGYRRPAREHAYVNAGGGELGTNGGEPVSGSGGTSSVAPDSYVGDFKEIRAWIERIVDRWREVPDPGRIAGWRTAFQPVVTSFGLGSVDGTGNVVYPNDGTLWFNLEGGATTLFGDVNGDGRSDDDEGLRGGAISAFKHYYQQLVNAVHACGLVVQFIDASLASEVVVWTDARYAAAQTVHRMAGVCERLANKGGGTDIGWDDILNGGSQVLGAASLVPGPHQFATGVGSLALSVVAPAAFPGSSQFSAFDYVDPPRPAIPSYSEAIKVLSLLLNGSKASVDATVTNVEQHIWDTTGQAINAITDEHYLLFNPRAAPITASPETLRHDREIALDVVDYTAKVSVKLCTAAAQVKSCRESASGDILRRHERIGIGSQGPYAHLDSLMFNLELVLKELGDEAYAASANLHAVVEALDKSEAERQELLQTTARSFESADAGYVGYYHNTPGSMAKPPPTPVIPNIDELTKPAG